MACIRNRWAWSPFAALEKAGLDEVAAREEMRVLIINTVGFAAFAAQPDGTGRRLITPLELRRNFERSLDWPFAGFTP